MSVRLTVPPFLDGFDMVGVQGLVTTLSQRYNWKSRSSVDHMNIIKGTKRIRLILYEKNVVFLT